MIPDYLPTIRDLFAILGVVYFLDIIFYYTLPNIISELKSLYSTIRTLCDLSPKSIDIMQSTKSSPIHDNRSKTLKEKEDN